MGFVIVPDSSLDLKIPRSMYHATAAKIANTTKDTHRERRNSREACVRRNVTSNITIEINNYQAILERHWFFINNGVSTNSASQAKRAKT